MSTYIICTLITNKNVISTYERLLGTVIWKIYFSPIFQDFFQKASHCHESTSYMIDTRLKILQYVITNMFLNARKQKYNSQGLPTFIYKLFKSKCQKYSPESINTPRRVFQRIIIKVQKVVIFKIARKIIKFMISNA